MSGSPPIAYTSLIAFTDAIEPNVNASSTIGMKKSVVLTMQSPLPRSNTAASSFDSLPTSNPGNRGWLTSEWSMHSSTAGEILQPQPAPWEYWVSLIIVRPNREERQAGGKNNRSEERRVGKESREGV